VAELTLEDYHDHQLADCSTLGELLMLTLFLIQLYGEDAKVDFDAGYNNVSSFIRSGESNHA
jgi:hypothetical protein